MNDYEWLQYEVLENPVSGIIRFAVILLTGLLFKKFVSHHLSGLIYSTILRKRGSVSVDKFRELLNHPISLFFTLIVIYLACIQLHFPPSWELVSEKEFGARMVIWKLFKVSIFISLTWMLLRCVDYAGLVLMERARQTPNKSDDQLVSFFKEMMKVGLVIVSLFLILGMIFEINVAGLIAGLGIGGIAIALAAKDTLENLLGSFLIFLDKPFTVGDVIKSGGITGTVERIGFRSTLVRTVERTLVTVPNRKLMDTEVENISQRGTIRGLIFLTLNYQTSVPEIAEYIQVVRDQLNENPNVEKESIVRLEKFTELGLEISVTFYALTDKFDRFTRIREEVMLRMLHEASERGLRFAPRQGVV